MRNIIIKRIEELFQMEPPHPDSMRWGRSWYDPNLKHFGKPTKKEIALYKLTHVSQLDFQSMPEDALIRIFEYIIMRSYRQM